MSEKIIFSFNPSAINFTSARSLLSLSSNLTSNLSLPLSFLRNANYEMHKFAFATIMLLCECNERNCVRKRICDNSELQFKFKFIDLKLLMTYFEIHSNKFFFFFSLFLGKSTDLLSTHFYKYSGLLIAKSFPLTSIKMKFQ